MRDLNKENEVYLGLGSNIGDRKLFIDNALSLLAKEEGVSVDAVSRIIETEPWRFESDEKFLNCTVRVSVNENVTPEKLLGICKNIERNLGRNETVEYDDSGNRKYHSRTIDIDILLYGTRRIDTENLKIPHPLMKDRDFVMIPLREIVSDETREAFQDIFG